MNRLLLAMRRPLLAAAGAFVLCAASPFALAQPSVPIGVDQTPTRVLQIEQVLGAVSVQRGGRTEELRPGFLVFNEERVLLASRARANLALSRYGQIDVASSGDGPGALTFEKLPFSSWAVDLETRVKLERGLLRLRWARSGEAADWPLSVVIDRWSAQLGNGEFLFRRDERGILVCNVAGSIELSDENAGKRQELKPASCAQLKPGESAQSAALEAADWNELNVAILPTESGETLAHVQAPVPAGSSSSSKSPRIPIVSPPPATVQESETIIIETAPGVATVPGPAGSVAVTGIAPLPDVDVNVPLPAAPAPPVAPPAVAAKPAQPVTPVETPPPAAALPQSAPTVAKPAAPAVVAVPAIPSPAPPAAAAASPPAPEVITHATPAPAPANENAPSPPPVSMRPMAQADIPAVVPPVRPDAPGAKTTTVAKAATVMAVPATAVAPAEDTGPEWIVNVMTLTDPDVAKQHLATLTEAGYPAVLRTEMVRGRSSFRIIIGGISNEQGARRTAQLLASKMGYTAAWPLQKR